MINIDRYGNYNAQKLSQEIYLSAGYDILLSPTLTLYCDVEEGNGSWMTFSIGHPFEVLKDISVNLGALASYNFNNEVMGFDEDGDDFSDLYHGEFSLSVTIPVWKALRDSKITNIP